MRQHYDGWLRCKQREPWRTTLLINLQIKYGKEKKNHFQTKNQKLLTELWKDTNLIVTTHKNENWLLHILINQFNKNTWFVLTLNGLSPKLQTVAVHVTLQRGSLEDKVPLEDSVLTSVNIHWLSTSFLK